MRASPTEDYGYTERSDHIGQLFAANGIDSESPSLLAVDVLKLAEGWGFAGTLAPLIEMSEECTYRIVQGSTGDDNITGQWRGVKVHVRDGHKSLWVCASGARVVQGFAKTGCVLETSA